jgi:hypothetical protein
VMKKAGIVAAITAGLMMAGGTAFASPDEPGVQPGDGNITYEESFYTFNQGGAMVGQGAAMMVSGAYTGITLTPAHVQRSFGNH